VRSIRTKLTVIIIATSVLAVALVGVSARWITHTQFNTFRLEQTRSAFIDAATVYYQQHGSWAGAEVGLEDEINRILGVPRTAAPNGRTPNRHAPDGAANNAVQPAPPQSPTGVPAVAPTVKSVQAPAPAPPGLHPLDRFERRNPFALISVAGVTVIGNHRWHRGDVVPGRVIAGGTPVMLDSTRIGTVTYDQPPELRTLERIYLRRTGQALFYAAIAAFALALAVGILATRFFTRPIRDLTGAIRKMRAGELEQSVPVFSNDEFGEMALAFNDMSAEVARSQRLREQMTADIAHDLRTPLSVLTGYLESIREGVLEATPEAVDTMYTEATLLQRLVEDLRTLSMADAGRLSLQLEAVDAGDLLRAARQAFAPLAEQAGVHMELAVEEPPPRIDVDPSRMRQVFANLIGNALHHTSRGGRIVLGARREDDGVVLTVQDDGRGIASEALPHIFERFYRGDTARSEPGVGSGLGLPIARSLVIAHNGTIEASSELHHGTTITIRLPEAAA
jgi:two-component system, OmpR family, sensor histidine kinase BaeS